MTLEFAKSDRGRDVLLYDGHRFNLRSRTGSKSIWDCCRRRQEKCSGKIHTVNNEIVYYCNAHNHSPDDNRRAKDAAIERLKELTISAPEGTKAVDIVRTMLSELPPEVQAVMPDEGALRQRVSNWSRTVTVTLVRGTFDDYSVEEGVDNVPPPPPKTNGKRIKKEPAADNSGEMENTPMLIYLKGHLGIKHIVMIGDITFNWMRDLEKGAIVYRCQEARVGCKATVKIFREEKRYEIRGTHDHQIGFSIPPSNQPENTRQGRPSNTLRLVDEEGCPLEVPVNQILTAGKNSTPFRIDYDNLPRISVDPVAPDLLPALQPIPSTSRNIPHKESSQTNYTNDDFDGSDEEGVAGNDSLMDDYGNDDETEAQILSNPVPVIAVRGAKTVITSSKALPVKADEKHKKSKSKKSGERCFVCGDELLVAETLSCSADTFRKACCYLNIKSEKEWFPKTADGRFYSFCESCTNEIMRIHDLYRKVEEIQSLIFQKVENVEKRIADAEIVDNWMAEAPLTTAVRFEGFRKQVLINYRNKLKLRREIRTGKKLGHQLLEIQPISSAHMFAKDPAETEAFRRMEPLSQVHPFESTSSTMVASAKSISRNKNRQRGQPKSKKSYKELSDAEDIPSIELFTMGQETVLGLPIDNNSPDFCFDDAQDDVNSEVFEQEVKFWEEDPSKLRVNKGGSRKDDDYGSRDDTNFDGDEGLTDNSDPDYNTEDDDDDWGVKKSRTRRTGGKRKQSSKKKSTVSPSAEPEPKRYLKIAERIAIARAERAAKAKDNLPVEIQQPGSKKSTQKPKRKVGSGNFAFPDSTLTRDGRIFMSGIEIIKNAPGTSALFPYTLSFTCGACEKISQNFYRIREHICGQHLGMYKCNTCGKQFNESKSLKKHMKLKHSNREPRPCPICSWPTLTDNRGLKLHMWTHLGEEEKKDPKYSSWCPYSKRDPNRIKKLDGLQTYMCSYCSKTFYRSNALRRHEMTHTGEGPVHMCHFCGKTYNNSRTMWIHTQICKIKTLGIEVTTRYPCPKCPIVCKSRVTRSKHVKRFHSNVQDPSLPFSCPKCPRCFSSRNGFKEHRRTCKGEQPVAGSSRTAREQVISSSGPRHSLIAEASESSSYVNDERKSSVIK